MGKNKAPNCLRRLRAAGGLPMQSTLPKRPELISQRMMFKVAPSHFRVAARPGRPRTLISVMTVVRWLFLFLYFRVNFFEGVCNLVEKQ
jgi:hypothetical protein